MKFAIASRQLQFTAGPQSEVFYACEQHRALLDTGFGCFYPTKNHPVEPVDDAEEMSCDLCREG